MRWQLAPAGQWSGRRGGGQNIISLITPIVVVIHPECTIIGLFLGFSLGLGGLELQRAST